MDINHVNIFSLILGIQRPKIDCGKCKHIKYVYMCILNVFFLSTPGIPSNVSQC